jgi:hypothetical protein
MATQIVMDRTGDTRHHFDPENAADLVEAEKRFEDLTTRGFVAAKRTSSGQTTKLRSFDPTEETLFFPRMVGG